MRPFTMIRRIALRISSSVTLIMSSTNCRMCSKFSRPTDTLFQAGATAYRAADYTQAAEAFRQSVTLQPASGALQDLGNAEWQSHRTGEAILAWEQALWLDPYND